MITDFNDWQEMLQNRNEPKEEIKNPFKDRADEIHAKSQERIERLRAEPETSNHDASRMLELRKAVQLFLSTMDADTQLEDMMAVATVFPKFQIGKTYKIKEVFSYGENGVGDPQLYQVLQAHTSDAEHTPDNAVGLYKKIGVTEDGYPEWVQPLGATDAYNTGDEVAHNGKHWVSDVDNNVWEPGVYGWTEKNE